MAFDLNDSKFVSSYDSFPFWSSHFGHTLLNAVEYRKHMTVLDVGTGTGFPAIELAERLGGTSTVYGVDLWEAALDRARAKSEALGVENVRFQTASVCDLPFEANTFDLVTSCNCLNNVEEDMQALAECHRVLKPGGRLVQTGNLPETMTEFYAIFQQLLLEKSMFEELDRLGRHVCRLRKTTDQARDSTEQAGFRICAIVENHFTWPFATGTALLEHSFIRLAFLPEWRAILREEARDAFFLELEERLNIVSATLGSMSVTIPYICITAEKK